MNFLIIVIIIFLAYRIYRNKVDYEEKIGRYKQYITDLYKIAKGNQMWLSITNRSLDTILPNLDYTDYNRIISMKATENALKRFKEAGEPLLITDKSIYLYDDEDSMDTREPIPFDYLNEDIEQ
jgi:hypothetical protein